MWTLYQKGHPNTPGRLFKLYPWEYFIHISITTPVVSALKLKKLLLIYHISIKLSISRNSKGYFKPLLKPGGGFTSETETAARTEMARPLRNRFRIGTVTNL
jgi:hypothetical protein